MVAPRRRTRQLNLQRIRQEETRAEQRQKKYRYLYQVRTAHGDVISQVLSFKFYKKYFKCQFCFLCMLLFICVLLSVISGGKILMKQHLFLC